MSQLAELARSAGPLGAVQLASVGFGLVSVTIWARWLPKEAFGEFRLVLSLLDIAGALCVLGIGQAALMSASNAQDGSFIILLRQKFVVSVLGGIGLASIGVYYFLTGHQGAALGLAVAAVLFPLYNLSDVWQGWENGKARFQNLATGRLILSAIPVVAVGIAALLATEHSWLVLLLMMSATAALNIVLLLLAGRRSENREHDPSILTFGNHSSAALMVGAFVSVDTVLLNHWFSPAEVAVYVVALQCPLLVKTLVSIIGSLVYPRIYRASSSLAAWQAIRTLFWTTTGMLLMLGAAGWLLLPWLIHAMFSSNYAEAAEYSRWLWLAMCVFGSTTFLGGILSATKNLYFLYLGNVGFAIVSLSLYLLLGRYGAAGMIAAKVAGVTALAAWYAGCCIWLIAKERRATAGLASGAA